MGTNKHKGTFTSAIRSSTFTFLVDLVFRYIYINLLFLGVFVIFVSRIFPLIIEANFFIRFNVPDRKYNKKRFLDVAFVDIAGIKPAIRIARMILKKRSFGKITIISYHITYQKPGEL